MAAGYDGSIKIDTSIDTKQITPGINSITASLKKMAAAVGIAFGVGAIINFGKKSVEAATELSNALIGLQSIMEGQGRSFAKAREFINSYVSDGLIPATQAITAYKNLALRGYDDTQIQQVLIALKDSAAFGRQASYTLGEAVAGATEGLKNENSILVDNAGVTKNVAKMWEDYAKNIGVTATSLTKQQKIQAEVLGILEETRFQTGDASKITQTYSGWVQRLSFNFNNLKIAVGNALMPIAQAVMPSINAMINGLTRLANIFAQVSTAMFGAQVKQQAKVAETASDGAKAETGLAKATEKAGKAAQKAVAGFDELNVLTENTAESAGAIEDGLGIGESNPVGTGDEIGGVTVSPAVQAAVDRIKEIFEGLKDWYSENLDPIFRGFGQNLLPQLEKLKQALLGWWDDISPLLKERSGQIIELFGKLWQEAIAPAIEVINNLWLGLWNSIKGVWEKWGSPLFEGIKTALQKTADFLQQIWETFIKPIWETIMKNVDWLWEKHLKPLLDNFFDFVGELINGALRIYNEFILPFVSWFTTKFGPPIVNALQTVIDIFFSLLGTISDITSAAITSLKGIIQFITGAFLGDWNLAWEGIQNTFKATWDALAGIIKGVVNIVIDLINGMIRSVTDGINAIIRAVNSVSISVPDWVPGVGGTEFKTNVKEITAYQIPKLATGAVIPPRSEYLAILGDQKSGTNVEAPLATIEQAVENALERSGGGGQPLDIDVTVKFEGHEVQFIRWLKPKIDVEVRRRGANAVKGGAL